MFRQILSRALQSSKVSVKNPGVTSFFCKSIRCFQSDASAATIHGVTAAQNANRKARLELAAAYRILDHMGLNEGVCNHLTLMAPAASGEGDVMLLIPHGLHWSEVTASNLVGLNFRNELVEGVEGWGETAATSIHIGVHQTKPNATCVLHLHPPYGTSLGCTEDPTIKMIHQVNLRFFDNVAYDTNYEGFAEETDEGKRLSDILQDKSVLIMGNHGVLVTAPTVAVAFDRLYYLERACMYQILALSTGKNLKYVAESLHKPTFEKYLENEEYYANQHFYARIRILQKKHPEFAA